MTDRPIDLDGHRSPDGKIGSELRRRAVNRDLALVDKTQTADIYAQMTHSAQSVRAEIEAMERAVFFLRRYAASSEEDNSIQKMIMRAQSELARLRKREETRP